MPDCSQDWLLQSPESHCSGPVAEPHAASECLKVLLLTYQRLFQYLLGIHALLRLAGASNHQR
ncbi:MAG: hypothetical protein WAO83_05270 [Fuerstiella sp.]